MKAARSCLACVCAAGLSAVLAGPAAAQSTNWRGENAYTLGVQAYIYGFPWYYFSQLRWQYVTTVSNVMPYAPLNKFAHADHLTTAADRTGGSPNNDTLYSTSWLCLTNEPVILSVPAITGRYYTFEMACMDSDNFAYVGTRATGTNAGDYAVIGPGWTGSLPIGVTALATSRTPYVFVLGRTLVFGTDDVVNVQAIQAQYKLTALSYWPGTDPTTNRNVWPPYPTNDTLGAWKTINRAMTENPPNVPSQQSMVNYFATIGVGPGQDVESMGTSITQALVQAAQDAMEIMHGFNMSGGAGHVANGWAYPPETMGRAGQHDDFLTRAAAQCWAGIVANDPQEAVYLNTSTDNEGIELNGVNDYIITFPSNGLPDVQAFWSVSMYGFDHNFVSNSLDRYKLGTYPLGLMKTNADGSLTIYIQNESPGAELESNWLPAPATNFYLIMRTYLPGSNIVNQTWNPPAVQVTVRRPTLSLKNQLVNGVVVTWPSRFTNWYLQRNVQPSTNWTDDPAVPEDDGTNKNVPVSSPLNYEFYRLRRP